MTAQVLVLAKEPLPGRVKTRLCPPCTPQQAAALAAAALADTIEAVNRMPAGRVLVIDGTWPVPPGWRTVYQRGGGLDERIAAAFADTRQPGTASLLIGMDTPQVTPELLTAAIDALGDGNDAMLGPAEDGGWWALALREPEHAALLVGVPTSVAETGELTLRALRTGGLRVGLLPTLTDVDTAADALAVAERIPGSRFGMAARALLAVRS